MHLGTLNPQNAIYSFGKTINFLKLPFLRKIENYDFEFLLATRWHNLLFPH